MIAIGGAIGTGLFLGAGGRLHAAGPALAIAYAVCGLFAFFVVKALGELVLHRPSSGSFVSYAREFLGEKGAYVAGWMYVVNWSTTGIADITAIALYTHYWSLFTDIPQWVMALIALAVVLTVNLISVKIFGELEFWFAIIKVAALVVFMFIGIFLLATQHPVDGHTPGLNLLTDHGGIFPTGLLPVVIVLQGVVFAYSAVELVGVTAGETGEPEKVVPKAVNSIMWRVGVFYVGSVILLAMLLPWNKYVDGESPFVTVLSNVGVPAAGDVMNLVVLTAAMSSLNSGLYSTGRILRSMSMAGSAPKFAGLMNRNQVPYGGIMLTSAVCAGRRAQLRRAGRGVRDRAEHRGAGHHQHLVHDHGLPHGVRAAVEGGPGRAPALPAPRHTGHRHRHHRLPARRHRPDVVRRRRRPADRHADPGPRRRAGRRLVRGPRPGEPDRRGARTVEVVAQ